MTEDESSDEGEDESDDDEEDEDESSDEEQPQQQAAAAAAAPKVGVCTLSFLCIPRWGVVWLGKQGRTDKNIDSWVEQSINIH
jgi:hypothetical protein